MLHTIGNIFVREPRQAEQTDTRQGIKRHDPDQERSRRRRKEDTSEEFGEDFAHVSVEALSVFLKNFVKEQAAEELKTDSGQPLAHEATIIEPDNIVQEQPVNRPTNPAAAKAASAYQSMSQSHKQDDVLIETTDTAQGPAFDLSAEDVRAINVLIEDLETLKKARIETLTIERAASFLESLTNAVQQAKATL